MNSFLPFTKKSVMLNKLWTNESDNEQGKTKYNIIGSGWLKEEVLDEFTEIRKIQPFF